MNAINRLLMVRTRVPLSEVYQPWLWKTSLALSLALALAFWQL